jgi:antibiotic biosynthesis monooxygenase (ABM) superfamily enzyme
MTATAGQAGRSVSIVTQTCVRPERAEDFARWQGETSTFVSNFPGFLEQRLMPPKPPLQVDWVILQRFNTIEAARAWLASPERQTRIEGAAPMLVGRDDVHIVQDEEEGIKPSPASVVISTRVLPGKETEYRAWERKIAAAQSKAPGLQGYRFEPPVPGVQEDFVAILRFDTETNLQAWLSSPVRAKLIAEAAPLTEEFHTRMARTGFDQWFQDAAKAGDAPLPVWKMDMLVLLMLYPIVFLFGVFVGTPLFNNVLHLPWAVALFLGNVVSVGLTGVLVPWIAGYFGWWLNPASAKGAMRTHLLGAAIIAAAYAIMVVAFWRFF